MNSTDRKHLGLIVLAGLLVLFVIVVLNGCTSAPTTTRRLPVLVHKELAAPATVSVKPWLTIIPTNGNYSLTLHGMAQYPIGTPYVLYKSHDLTQPWSVLGTFIWSGVSANNIMSLIANTSVVEFFKVDVITN